MIAFIVRIVRFLCCAKPRCKYCGKRKCNPYGIDVKYCPLFHPIKMATASEDYVLPKLQPHEENGYCAAGFFIKQNGKVLMIQETRGGITLYNFIGGKREYREESYFTALRECHEEAPEVYTQNELLSNVLWYAYGKYALYSIEAGACAPIRTPRLKWFDITDLKAWKEQEVLTDHIHPFAVEMINAIDEDIGLERF